MVKAIRRAVADLLLGLSDELEGFHDSLSARRVCRACRVSDYLYRLAYRVAP
jgi:hypothetical protein